MLEREKRIVHWVAHYAGGKRFEGFPPNDAAQWAALPAGLLILDLFENWYWKPGNRYRRRLCADWYGRWVDAEGVVRFDRVKAPKDAKDAKCAWVKGAVVKDAVFDAAEIEAEKIRE